MHAFIQTILFCAGPALVAAAPAVADNALPLLALPALDNTQTFDLDTLLTANGLAKQPLRQPPTYASVNGQLQVNMDVDVGQYNGPVSFNTRLYNGQFPAPTIRIKAGDTLTVNFNNKLGPNIDDKTYTPNTIHTPNTTNLHTHGLHVSPHMPQDDVLMVAVKPGESFRYQYNLQQDHYPGSHWFHPHNHGSVMVQVDGGMAGMLIVDDDPATTPQELLAMDDVVAVVQGLYMSGDQLVKNQANGGTSTVDVAMQNPFNITRNLLVVNGQYKPVLNMQPGELKRVRFCNALGMDGLYFGVKQNQCEFTLLALDGVYLDVPRQEDGVYLPPGGRADVAVRCQTTGNFAISTMGSEDWLKQQGGIWLAGTGVPGDEQDMLVLQVEGQYVNMALPAAFQVKPSYLSDLRSIDTSLVTDQWSVQYSMPGDSGPVSMSINGLPFVANTPQRNITVGGIAEWTLTNGNNMRQGSTTFLQHPHHQHVNHFQLMNNDAPTNGKFFRAGDWRDTVPLWFNTPALMRFHVADFVGPLVMHCHALRHEDMGMMAWVMIQDENGSDPTAATMRM